MIKIKSKIQGFMKSCCRLLSLETSEKPLPKPINIKHKVIYGGDVTTPTYKKSFASLLFSRLMNLKNKDGVLQVCESTKRTMSATDLLKKAVAVARRLEVENIKKGDIVVLIGENSLNLNVAVTGLFLLGAVPAPMSTRLNGVEFQIIVKSVRPKIFFIDQSFVEQIKVYLREAPQDYTSKMFLLDEKREEYVPDLESFEEFIKDQNDDVESFTTAEVENPEKELALVMKPLSHVALGRLVGITHYNINSLIARFDSVKVFKLSNQVILMVQKMAWMSGVYSYFISACFGAKLIVMNKFDEERFMLAIEEYKVTCAIILSSKAWRLYKHDYSRQYDVSSLRFILTTDGSMSQALVVGIKEKLGIRLRPSYGVSELTGLVLQSLNSRRPGSTGKLNLGVYAKVVSERTNLTVGPNELGIICFKGPTLTMGYINDKKSTQALFDKDGFLVSEMFGYYDEEGFFYVIDRVHNVIRHKNCEVSPRELEDIINLLDEVRDVVVGGIQHPTDDYWPLALVVLRPKSKLTAELIIKHVDGLVEDCKRLRAGVIFLKKIPRSKESGNIKRYLIDRILSEYRIPAEPQVEESATSLSLIKAGIKSS